MRGILTLALLCVACGPPKQVGNTRIDVDGPDKVDLPRKRKADIGVNQPGPSVKKRPDGPYVIALHKSAGRAWRNFVADCQTRLPSSHPLNKQKLRTEVHMAFDVAGDFVTAKIATPSGNANFDKAAVEVAREINAPSPPENFLSDDGNVHVSWWFARDNRLARAEDARVFKIRLPLTQATARFMQLGKWRRALVRIREGLLEVKKPTAEQITTLRFVFETLTIDALAGDDVAARRFALKAASEVPIKGATKALLQALGKADEREDRLLAVRALGQARVQNAKTPLEVLLADRDSGVSAAAAKALVDLGHEDKVKQTLKKRLVSNLAAGLTMLIEVPVAGFDQYLSKGLGSGKPTIMTLACQAAGARRRAGEAGVARVLLKGIQSPNKAIRIACAEAAASVKPGQNAKVLYWKVVEQVRKEPTPQARAAIVVAAAKMDPQRFTQVVYLVRKERNPVVLAGWAQALAVAKPAGANRIVKGMLSHNSDVVRAAAARAAMDLGMSEDTTPLKRDKSPLVREALLSTMDRATALAALQQAETATARAIAFRRWVGIVGPSQSAAPAVQYVLRAKTMAESISFATVWLWSARSL